MNPYNNGGNRGNDGTGGGFGPFDSFGKLTNMNEQLRRMFGPQFLQNIMKQVPMGDLDKLQNMPEWGQMFGGEMGVHGSGTNTNGHPRLDIYQTRQEVVAIAELPGLTSSQDVNISVKSDSLTLTGTLERSTSVREDRFFMTERFQGSFERTVTLPVSVRPTQVRATYRNGLLEVRMIKDQRRSPGPRAAGQRKRNGQSVPITFL
jgi:HSP20 family protein